MMASLWQCNYHCLILKCFKLNLFIYLHLQMSSSRVFSREEISVFGIANFSARHRLHFRVQPLYRQTLEAISQLIWYRMLLPFSSKMCLESSVLFCLLLLLNIAVWSSYRSLKVFFINSLIIFAYLWRSLWKCCFINKISDKYLLFNGHSEFWRQLYECAAREVVYFDIPYHVSHTTLADFHLIFIK